MGLLSFATGVYNLDALDTRFSVSSTTPYQTVIDTRSDPAAKTEAAAKSQSRAQPSKWKTPEFFFYYVVFFFAVPYMFWVPYSVSGRTSATLASEDKTHPSLDANTSDI